MSLLKDENSLDLMIQKYKLESDIDRKKILTLPKIPKNTNLIESKKILAHTEKIKIKVLQKIKEKLSVISIEEQIIYISYFKKFKKPHTEEQIKRVTQKILNATEEQKSNFIKDFKNSINIEIKNKTIKIKHLEANSDSDNENKVEKDIFFAFKKFENIKEDDFIFKLIIKLNPTFDPIKIKEKMIAMKTILKGINKTNVEFSKEKEMFFKKHKSKEFILSINEENLKELLLEKKLLKQELDLMISNIKEENFNRPTKIKLDHILSPKKKTIISLTGNNQTLCLADTIKNEISYWMLFTKIATGQHIIKEDIIQRHSKKQNIINITLKGENLKDFFSNPEAYLKQLASKITLKSTINSEKENEDILGINSIFPENQVNMYEYHYKDTMDTYQNKIPGTLNTKEDVKKVLFNYITKKLELELKKQKINYFRLAGLTMKIDNSILDLSDNGSGAVQTFIEFYRIAENFAEILEKFGQYPDNFQIKLKENYYDFRHIVKEVKKLKKQAYIQKDKTFNKLALEHIQKNYNGDTKFYSKKKKKRLNII